MFTLSSCAKKISFSGSAVVPAARGFVKVKKDLILFVKYQNNSVLFFYKITRTTMDRTIILFDWAIYQNNSADYYHKFSNEFELRYYKDTWYAKTELCTLKKY